MCSTAESSGAICLCLEKRFPFSFLRRSVNKCRIQIFLAMLSGAHYEAMASFEKRLSDAKIFTFRSEFYRERNRPRAAHVRQHGPAVGDRREASSTSQQYAQLGCKSPAVRFRPRRLEKRRRDHLRVFHGNKWVYQMARLRESIAAGI